MNYNGFDMFVNQKIEDCRINPSKDTMYWKVDGKWYCLDALGDCCSHSWFEHCDNADALIGGNLLEVESVGGDDIWSDYGNLIQVNMLKFKTDKGNCTIEFRNESNGYYSGWTEIRECGTDNPGLGGFKVLEDM